MSPLRIIIILAAAAAAILAAFLVRNLASSGVEIPVVSETLQIQEKEVSEVKVLVAGRDFAVGDVLTPEDFEWAPWPEKSVVAGYEVSNESSGNSAAVERLTGSVVRAQIFEREPILPQKLVVKGDSGVMAALLAPGMRAATVEVSTETASGGFILPDDRVDVILTQEVTVEGRDSSTERAVTTTIMENIRVLAVDQAFKQDELGGQYIIGNTATLEVTPAEAELLALSERMGSLSMSLRPWSDAGERGRKSKVELLEGASPNGSGAGGITVFRNGKASSAGGS